METACRLNRFMMHYLTRLVQDVPDERLAEQPTPGVNNPAWLLGHLAVVPDYGLPLIGGGKLCPDDWHRTFAPGTTPQSERTLYPSKADLLAAIERGYQALCEHSLQATPEQLAAPQPVAFLQTWMPTVNDILMHLLTTHFATHLGQLSAWRRQAGFTSVSL